MPEFSLKPVSLYFIAQFRTKQINTETFGNKIPGIAKIE